MSIAATEYPYRYVWRPRYVAGNVPVLNRKGALCRIVARGGMNSALVEFECDGYLAVISRNALRRAKP